MKYFFVSDIHGYFDKMMNRLKEVGFEFDNPEHILCIAGDFFDGGPHQVKLFRWIREKSKSGKVIVVRGNHDDLHVDRPLFYDEAMEKELIELHKIEAKEMTFNDYAISIDKEIKEFVDSLPFFVENDHFVMVHAGIDPTLPDWRKGPVGGVMWADTMTWMEHENKERIRKGCFKNFGKKVITGHTWVENHHFYLEHGFPQYDDFQPDHSLNNVIFEHDDYVCVDGKWHEADSKGLVYIMEVN